MTPAQTIRNSAPGILDLFLYGGIGISWDLEGIDAGEVARQIETSNARQINVYINSAGGQLSAGVAIYNALRRHAARKTTYVDGFALSIASVIFQAGDERLMGEGTFLMLHNPAALAVGTAEELKATAEMLEQAADNLVAIYTARSGRNEADVRRMMADETWLTPADAVAEGFADRVLAVQSRAVAGPLPDLAQFKKVPADAFRSVLGEAKKTIRGALAELEARAASTMQRTKERPMAASETNEAAPPVPAAAAAPAPKPASLAELKAAFPGADAAWRETQLEAAATIEQAGTAWRGKLEADNAALTSAKADLEKKLAAQTASGRAPSGLNFSGGSTDSGDAAQASAVRADFITAAREYASKHDAMTVSAAMSALAALYPQSHAAWVAAQPHRPNVPPANST